ncbi:MAG: PTS sugar transporter subunit IIA, partial [Candidatus Omnitrophica bacterium]|nr:PTS sugar transporter subunit IIA [Candidatus Omnitrophota bacterium]
EQVIAELVNAVVRAGSFKNKKLLYKGILDREKLGSTAIGNNIAIPHTKIEKLKKLILVFGRSAAGVDFDSLDGGRTHLFFLLISPKENIGIHLKVLATISHLVKDKFNIALLRKARNKKEVIAIIAGIEKRLRAS